MNLDKAIQAAAAADWASDRARFIRNGVPTDSLTNDFADLSEDERAEYISDARPLVEAAAADIALAAYEAVIERIRMGIPYMTDRKYAAGATWVQSQIEDVLTPLIPLIGKREGQ